MADLVNAKSYIQLLQARVGQCASIAPTDRNAPTRQESKGAAWVIRRCPAFQGEQLFENDKQAQEPFQLVQGGRLEFYVRLRQRPRQPVEVVTYRVALFNPPKNDNGIESVRFDQSEGQSRGDGWDEEIGDNPAHPWAHMHINFHLSAGANDCRMPTGRVCPILLLRAIDHWYCGTFVQ